LLVFKLVSIVIKFWVAQDLINKKKLSLRAHPPPPWFIQDTHIPENQMDWEDLALHAKFPTCANIFT
jgi:hypothetical protein